MDPSGFTLAPLNAALPIGGPARAGKCGPVSRCSTTIVAGGRTARFGCATCCARIHFEAKANARRYM